MDGKLKRLTPSLLHMLQNSQWNGNAPFTLLAFWLQFQSHTRTGTDGLVYSSTNCYSHHHCGLKENVLLYTGWSEVSSICAHDTIAILRIWNAVTSGEDLSFYSNKIQPVCLPTRWRRKPAGIAVELNYVTVILRITGVAVRTRSFEIKHCFLPPLHKSLRAASLPTESAGEQSPRRLGWTWRSWPHQQHSTLLKKVKFSHTRYRALGPELIPVYRQSAHRWRESRHIPGSSLLLLSARPAFTFVAFTRLCYL